MEAGRQSAITAQNSYLRGRAKSQVALRDGFLSSLVFGIRV
jgi:hypothetical protein